MFMRQPAANLQSASMLLLFALLILTLVTGIVGLCQLRKSKYRGFIPFGICGCSVLLIILLAPGMGGWMRIRRFPVQMPRYLEVVRLIERGEIRVDSSLAKVNLPESYEDLAVAEIAKTNSAGSASVEFLIGGGFPGKHSGYLYMPISNIEADAEMAQRWPKHKKSCR